MARLWKDGESQRRAPRALGALFALPLIVASLLIARPTKAANAPPTLNPIGNKAAAAGAQLTFTVTATDADDDVDDILTFSATATPSIFNSPYTAQFNQSSGAFTWTPGGAEAGNYAVVFCVSDGEFSDCETITIVVVVSNDPPTANAGGPYGGCVGDPIQFNGGGSSDPDAGQTLAYDWNFGDGSPHSSSQSPTHSYAAAGTYNVALTVTDNGTPTNSDSDATSVVITNKLQGSSASGTTNNLNLVAGGSDFDVKFLAGAGWSLSDIDLAVPATLKAVGYAGSVTSLVSFASGSPTKGQVQFSNASMGTLLSGFSSRTYVPISFTLDVQLKNVIGCNKVRITFTANVKKN